MVSFRGVIVPMVTPFDQHFDPGLDRLEEPSSGSSPAASTG